MRENSIQTVLVWHCLLHTESLFKAPSIKHLQTRKPQSAKQVLKRTSATVLQGSTEIFVDHDDQAPHSEVKNVVAIWSDAKVWFPKEGCLAEGMFFDRHLSTGLIVISTKSHVPTSVLASAPTSSSGTCIWDALI